MDNMRLLYQKTECLYLHLFVLHQETNKHGGKKLVGWERGLGEVGTGVRFSSVSLFIIFDFQNVIAYLFKLFILNVIKI